MLYKEADVIVRYLEPHLCVCICVCVNKAEYTHTHTVLEYWRSLEIYIFQLWHTNIPIAFFSILVYISVYKEGIRYGLICILKGISHCHSPESLIFFYRSS